VRCVPRAAQARHYGQLPWLQKTKNASRELALPDTRHNCIRNLYYASSNGLSRKKKAEVAAPHIPLPKMLDCVGTSRVDSKSACNRTIQLSML